MQNGENFTDYEKGIEVLNSILFCHNIEELLKLKPKVDSMISVLKSNFNSTDPSIHKDNLIELIQDLLVAYHDKEQSLELMKRELSLQRYIKYLSIGLILVIGFVFFISSKVFVKTNTGVNEKSPQISSEKSLEISQADRTILLEEKVQDLQREKEKTFILLKNLKKDNDRIINDLDKAKEKITYLEGLIREIRIERNFSR